MSSSTICALARFTVKPGQAEAFKALIGSIRDATRAEAGCFAYSLNQSLDDPTSFIFVEEWESEAAMAGHLAAPHVRAILPALQDLLAAPPAVERLQPIW